MLGTPGKTRSDVLSLVEKHDVRFVELQFTDVLGMIKSVSLPISQIEEALDGKIMFDGSSIEGFARIQESDMYLRPDYDTFTILPWLTKDGTVARLICDVYTPEGVPFAGCPRTVLKKVAADAQEQGFELYAGPEQEFFLLETDAKGRPILTQHDAAGYFDLAPIDRGLDARREMVIALQQMGYEVEASHHEVAPGQHEIDFKYDSALRAADNIVTFRMVAKAIAARCGLYASFLPKPFHGLNGSGMHTHMSVFQNGRNVFYDPAGPNGFSETALHFIGGLLYHARGFTAVTNPLINSYKRLIPGYEAPVYVCWSSANRSALVRVPAATGNATRVELRNPDPAVNPYLALAVVFAAGLDGIAKRIEPPPECLRNVFAMSEREKAQEGIVSLPGSLREALGLMEKDGLVRSTLGEHIYGAFVRAKTAEWNEYRQQVTTWELERYLPLY